MFKFKNKTLSRDYFLFAAIIAVVIVGFSGWRTYQAYTTLETDRKHRHETEANKISSQLEESFDYLDSFMRLIANDISRLNSVDPAKIAPILEKSWPRIKDSGYNYFSWSVLDFSDAKGMDLASSMNGVLNPPVALPTNRAWIKEGPENPGKLIFSEPDIGVLTNQFILPVGYGIKTQSGKYLGAISISFNISALTKKFETTARPESSFLILDTNNKIIAQSGSDKKKIPVDFIQDSLKNTRLDQKFGKLQKPIVYEDISYSYYRKLQNYPFVVLVGDYEYYTEKQKSLMLSPRIEQSVILGVFFLFVLYFFQRRIIRPVKALSDAAVAISNGRTDIEMPKTDIHEYQVLGNQLANIKEIINRLNTAQKDLEEALKAKSSFLSNVSHEFRTPLNAVIGFSETIKKKVFGDIGNDKYADYVDNINEQGQYLLKLIEDILDASKMESGKVELHEEPFDFQRLVKDCIKTVQQRAEAKRIELINESSEDLPYIKADKTKIKQVILNLFSNAIKFTAERNQVYIRTYVDASDFVFEVEDRGIGIAKDDLKRIAQRFAQVDNLYTRKNRGSGLGMSITKDIVEMHGGSFLIESELNKGTKITVRLPKDRIIFGSKYGE